MSFYEAKKYINYKLKAKNEHSIHSPFVFKLYCEVIKPQEKYYAFDSLNKLRSQLLRNNEIIEVTDLGAGSKKLTNKRRVSEIARVSVIPQKYGELLFRLVNFFKPNSILELGTSLGLSALYMHNAAPNGELITVEGCPNTCAFAKKLITEFNNFSSLSGDADARFAEGNGERRGPVLVNSPFETAFQNELANKKFDFAYIDGNHTYEATIKYFHELLKMTHENSVLIFDDIYWSEGMTKAWEEIGEHEQVTVTIDLFKFGIVFFRKENKQKEHFCLRY
ncbi:MAG: O-methyltransferase [Bacteroidia bacterium]